MSTGRTSPVNEVGTKIPYQTAVPKKNSGGAEPTVQRTQRTTKSSHGALEKIVNFLGQVFGIIGPDNTPYLRFLGQTAKVGFDDPELKKKTILDNADWVFRKAEQVVEYGKKQIARGRNPWDGLPEHYGVPMSGEQQIQSGNTPEQRYYHNAFFYNASKALLDGHTILDSEDLDGTNTDKSTITFATRTVQAPSQIHWNNQAVQGAIDDLGIEYMLNTARGFGTKLLARNEGLEGSFTYGMHNSPLEELAGFDLKDQIALAERIMIAAMNGSVFHSPDKPTRISNKMLRADVIFREFPELVAEFFTTPTCEHEFSAAESKGMTNYTLDTYNVISSKYKYLFGDVYYPNFLRIVQFKEECVDNRDSGVSEEKAWENFRDKLLNDEEHGVLPGLELYKAAETTKKILDELETAGFDHMRLVAAKEEFLEGGNVSSNPEERQRQWADYLNTINFKLESELWFATEGSLIEYKNRFSHLIDFDNLCLASSDLLYDGTQKLQTELIQEQTYAFNYIRLLGSIEGDLEGNDLKQYDYYNLLLSNPQAFFEKATGGRLTALCFHFFNSRGTPREGSISDAVDTLRQFANKRQIREKVRELNTTSKRPHPDIMAFLREGKRVFREKGAKSYLEWRLLQHMMHVFKKKELEENPIFKCTDTELYFSETFLHKWEAEKATRLNSGKNEIEEYLFWLREQFIKTGGPSVELVDYMETVFPDEFVRAPLSIDLLSSRYENYFYPDELFSINNKIAYTGEYSFHSIFALVDKRSALKPDADFYLELQPAKEKFSAVPSFSACKYNNYYVVSSGDSPSDTGTHVAALERGGTARIIYGLITDDDIYNEGISQRILYANNIERHEVGTSNRERAISELEIACNDYGTYGLEKAEGQNGYRKVVVQDGNIVYLDNSKVFSKKEIVSEIKVQYAGRIDRNPSPAAKIRRFAELVQLLTGRKIDFSEKELELAKRLYAKDPTGESYPKGTKEREIFDNYRWAIVEEEKASLVSNDVPKFRVYFEYHDKRNNSIYFRRKQDGNLVTKEGQLFHGDESRLIKVPIIRNHSGNFVYKNTEEPYQNPGFLNNVLCEELYLPNASPVQGLFASKGFLKVFGFGQGVEKGKERLKAFVSAMPTLYHGALEWAGGLMALGGVLRLGSNLIGGQEGMLNKSGYWLSNTMRAFSAFTGALRGLLNVQKYYDITAGEIINMASALFLPNGPKHLGIGIGNLVLFTGRGRQRAQLQQRINNFTLEERDEKKPLDSIVDPRSYVRDITRFSTEGIILSAKNAAKKFRLSPVVGEIGGNILSALLTPIKMVGDVVREPRLITQWKARVSEKSGLHYRAAPSAGHLLTLVGLVSGVGAIVAGTLGRIGEVGEHGFNKLGNLAISFSNAIPAIGIIANGLEVANNPQGLPTISRGLDGKDMRFDPKRAGYGQVFAGIMYAILPWFGLHNDNVAALYDAFATAPYFGLPGTKMSVAEEEKHNTVKLGRSVLIEGQEFYNEKDTQIMLPKSLS